MEASLGQWGSYLCRICVAFACPKEKSGLGGHDSLPESFLEPVALDSQSMGSWGATADRFLPISKNIRHTVDAQILRIRQAQNNLLQKDAEISPRHTQ